MPRPGKVEPLDLVGGYSNVGPDKLESKEMKVLRAIERNTRLDGSDVESVHFMSVHTISTAIATGSSSLLTGTADITNTLGSGVRLYGLNYVVRYGQPFAVTDPKVGIAISKYTIASNLWTSSSPVQQEGLLHLAHHSSIPAQDEISFGRPRYLTSEDKVNFSIFIENDTGDNFSTTMRFHLTLYYRLAEAKGLSSNL